jgi:hypothetical protein
MYEKNGGGGGGRGEGGSFRVTKNREQFFGLAINRIWRSLKARSRGTWEPG